MSALEKGFSTRRQVKEFLLNCCTHEQRQPVKYNAKQFGLAHYVSHSHEISLESLRGSDESFMRTRQETGYILHRSLL